MPTSPAESLPFAGVFLPFPGVSSVDLRPEFWAAGRHDLISGAGMDAPDFRPTGSHASTEFGPYIKADGFTALHLVPSAPVGTFDCTPSEVTETGSSSEVAFCANGAGCNPTNAAANDTTTGNEKRKGRKPSHATPAARKAAYRAQKARIDYTDKPAIAATLDALASDLDCSKNELLQSLVRFALTNRNWRQLGLFGTRAEGVLQ